MNRHIMQPMLVDSTSYGQTLALAVMGPAGDASANERVSGMPTPPKASVATQHMAHWLWSTAGVAALTLLTGVAL